MNRSKKKPSIRLSELVPLILLSVLFLTGCSAAEQTAPIAAVLDTLDQATGSLADQLTAGIKPTDTPRLLAAQNGTLQSIYAEVNPSVVHIQVVGAPLDLPFDHPEFPDEPGDPGESEELDGHDEPDDSDDAGDQDEADGHEEDADGSKEADGELESDNPFFDAPRQSFGEGSGFVWDKEGHIVTNNHVIDSAEKITVLFADDTTVRAELVGADPDSDLAVLRVDLPADKLQPVTLGDSAGLLVGDLAIAIGNPFGQEGTMTTGIISALGRLLPVELGNPFAPRFNIPDVIQTDAAINPGNSGGVLLDGQGQVIGVTTAIISGDRASSSGIGFAVPSAIVSQVIPALIADGHYEHPYIGISGGSLTPDLAEAMNLPVGQRGVLVATIMPDGPAADADLIANDDQVEIDGFEIGIGGDIIIAADGQSITNMDDLITFLVRHTSVGQTINLTVLRDGREQTIDLKLAARPVREEEPLAMLPALLGMLGQPLTPELAEAQDLPADQSGILIQRVAPGSPAGEADLKEDDIITAIDDTPVITIKDLLTLFTEYEPGDEVSLAVLRDGEALELNLLLGESIDD